MLAALIAYAWARRPDQLLAPAITGAMGLAVVPWVLAAPLSSGEALGTIALIALSLALVFSLLQYVSRLFELVPLPERVARLTGISRLPVLGIVALWVIVAFALAADARHDVELVPASAAGAGRGETLESAFAAWVQDQPELAGDASGPAGPVPLVVVAAHGGGARSAYWTALVLDRLAGGVATNPYGAALPERGCGEGAADSLDAKRIFLISSVSGGSVGAYAYGQELERSGCLRRGWYEDWFKRDLLAPAVGWGLMHDLPALLVHQQPGAGGECRFEGGLLDWTCELVRDRARTLEDTLDGRANAHGRGLRAAEPRRPGVPLITYNSTSDDVEERVVLSRLRIGDAHRVRNDPIADMCGADVPELSAAILSARFPVITPTGRLYEPNCPDPTSASAVDGGYLENAGVATVADVLPGLEDLVRAENDRRGTTSIVIVAIEIANVVGRGGEGDPSRRTSLPPPSAPRQALLHVTGASEYISSDARERVRAAVTPTCFAYVQPPPARGWRASVGWRLSRAARQELESAIETLMAEASSQRVLQRAIRLASDPDAALCMNNGLEPPDAAR